MPATPSPATPYNPAALPVDWVAEGTDSAICATHARRRLTAQSGLIGIDTVEVEGTNLCVRFFGTIPTDLGIQNIRITGGQRIRDLRVLSIEPRDSDNPDEDSCLSVIVDREGDFSPYTIQIGDRNEDGVLCVREGFDPRYTAATFLFHPDCPHDTDCAVVVLCPPPDRVEPVLDYRAKDYASFRRLILDRWSLIMPDWKEQHVPDIGIALVEILAYVGDYLSYYQDAVGTEAYLETARERISVRRHARLVDYVLHEGNNARALVAIESGSDVVLKCDEFYFTTLSPEMRRDGRAVWAEEDLVDAIRSLTIFEPMDKDDIQIRAAHSRIRFYTWGDTECHLPRGATRATLWDAAPTLEKELLPPVQAAGYGQAKPVSAEEQKQSAATKQRVLNLRVGDLLILEEVRGAVTGNPADADPAHRHPVRLTQVVPGFDPLFGENTVEIEWAAADALPFTLCLSSRQEPTTPAEGQNLMPCQPLTDISVARGNVVLADHGQRVKDDLGMVKDGKTKYICRCDGSIADEVRTPLPFTPVLPRSPLTHAQPTPPGAVLPAADLLTQRPYHALPQIMLVSLRDTGWRNVERVWHARRDLLESGPRDAHFCVETDNEGRAHLRFGDGDAGTMLEAGTTFTANYRVGSGTSGNVGAEALRAVVFRQRRDGLDLRPRNPLPAQGGTDPEPVAAAKLFAPDAFRTERRRAVIPDDFAYFAQLDSRVQAAVSDLRWTGSWFEARTAVEARESKTGMTGETADSTLFGDLDRAFSRVRRIGWDAVAIPAYRVPIALEIFICVRPEYIAAQVAAAVKARFSAKVLPDGTRGFFHPDNLAFGQDIAISRIIAAAQSVPGVLSTQVTALSRQNEPSQNELEEGVLRLAPDEVAELTNDPNYPQRGLLRIVTKGGR